MFIFRRVEFREARVGPCGSTRYDSITPVGYEADFDMFKKEACDVLKNYGQQSYEGFGDEHSIEYFEGTSTDQNSRGDGQSIFKFILDGKKWNFYDRGNLQSSVTDINELEKVWQL